MASPCFSSSFRFPGFKEFLSLVVEGSFQGFTLRLWYRITATPTETSELYYPKPSQIKSFRPQTYPSFN